MTYSVDAYNLIDKVEGEFSLTIVLSRKKDGWLQMVTAMYGPNDQQRKPHLWREIREVRQRHNLSWIIGGDFNIIRFMNKHRGGIIIIGRELFNEVIDGL